MCFQANNLDKTPMPMLQTIPPANPYALALDHDYLRNTPQDLFLISEKVLA